MSEARTCLVCGCDDWHACRTVGENCRWVGERLCSACQYVIMRVLLHKRPGLLYRDLARVNKNLPYKLRRLAEEIEKAKPVPRRLTKGPSR